MHDSSTAGGKGYRRYATAGPLRAMAQFTEWIEREFPEFGKLDYRVVTVAFKCYGAFQGSDLNRRTGGS
jgi:hypothetical protein